MKREAKEIRLVFQVLLYVGLAMLTAAPVLAQVPVDENGNPTHDCRRNTVANFSVVDFDPANSAHVALAVAYATSDGDTSDDTVQWCVDTFGIAADVVRARLAV